MRLQFLAAILSTVIFKLDAVKMAACCALSRRSLLSFSTDCEQSGEVLRLIFAGYVRLASQSPYPIIVYSVASYGPHLSHFWANL